MPSIHRKPTLKPPNVLVLCHGNVCRSPLAGAVLARGLGEDRVRTAGCKSYDSSRRPPPAAKKVREYADRLGYDLSGHRARTVTQEDLAWAGLILYMDRGNQERMGEVLTTEMWTRARCLGMYVGLPSVPDPAFVPRGPELDRLLGLVVQASLAVGKELLVGRGVENENPRR